MARANQDRLKTAAVLALGLMLVIATGAYAEDPPFSGKWKGESRAAAPAGGAAAPGAAPGGAPGAGAAAAAPAGAPGGGAPGGGAGGGGRAGGGGGARGGFGGGGGGTQKATLNLKQSKDNKISGNLTIGEAETLDVKEGKVDGNTITFKVGRSGQPLTEYKGELNGSELILTRQSSTPSPTPAGGPGGGRGGFGGGGAATYVLSKK